MVCLPFAVVTCRLVGLVVGCGFALVGFGFAALLGFVVWFIAIVMGSFYGSLIVVAVVVCFPGWLGLCVW